MTDNPRISIVAGLGGSAPIQSDTLKVSYVPYRKLKPFPNTKFKSYHNEKIFEDLKASIAEIGIQQPIIVRKTENGEMVILAGHHRALAMEELGKGENIPAFVLENISDSQAMYIHLDTNGGRSIKNMLPSEMVFIVNEKLRLIKETGGGWKYLQEAVKEGESELLKAAEKGDKVLPRDIVAEETGLSVVSIFRYTRLKDLTDEMLNYVDKGNIPIKAGVELSFIDDVGQIRILETIEKAGVKVRISEAEAKALRNVYETTLTLPRRVVEEILNLSQQREQTSHLPEQREQEQEKEYPEGYRDENTQYSESVSPAPDEAPSGSEVKFKIPNITIKGDVLMNIMPEIANAKKKEVAHKIVEIIAFYKKEIPRLMTRYGITGNEPDTAVRDAFADAYGGRNPFPAAPIKDEDETEPEL
ncbi:MAG: ParB/RepB/Spo0J family partition protein [Bacillota bacterium]|nr:ParB/RepB/Spo0J family partition protein [Bacillota bacterium]